MPDRIETHQQQAWHWYHPELPARCPDYTKFRKRKVSDYNFQEDSGSSPSTQTVRQSSKVIFPYIICLLIDLFVSRKCTSSIFPTTPCLGMYKGLVCPPQLEDVSRHQQECVGYLLQGHCQAAGAEPFGNGNEQCDSKQTPEQPPLQPRMSSDKP